MSGQLRHSIAAAEDAISSQDAGGAHEAHGGLVAVVESYVQDDRFQDLLAERERIMAIADAERDVQVSAALRLALSRAFALAKMFPQQIEVLEKQTLFAQRAGAAAAAKWEHRVAPALVQAYRCAGQVSKAVEVAQRFLAAQGALLSRSVQGPSATPQTILDAQQTAGMQLELGTCLHERGEHARAIDLAHAAEHTFTSQSMSNDASITSAHNRVVSQKNQLVASRLVSKCHA
ncbi:hypothetical protein T484DRAFT_1904947, partial [Baffinella frigidus]